MEQEEKLIQTMVKTFHGVLEEGSERIWPGFVLTDRPVIFHFPSKHLYGFGLVSSSSQWRKLPAASFPLFFCREHPLPLPPLHPTYPIDGQPAFVMRLDFIPENPFLPLFTFVHEYFHLHQFRYFSKDEIAEAVLSDYQDVEILSSIEVEHHLLTSFLQAKEKEVRASYLQDYIVLSRYRREILQPETLLWEDHQQKMEGLADYVSLKTFQIFNSISNFCLEDYLLTMRKMKNPGCVNPEDALKGRHYFVGATLAYALDFFNHKNWKMKVESEGAFLQNLIEESFALTDEECLVRLDQLRKGGGWRGIQDDITRMLKEEEAKREGVLREFKAQEGVFIRMGTPSGPMSSGGSHKKSCQIDYRKAYFSDTSTSASQDQSWTLHFNSIPLIFIESKGDRLFKLPSDVLLQLDEREISLQQVLNRRGEEFSFLTLSLKHGYCELDSRRPGRVKAQGELLSFEFD